MAILRYGGEDRVGANVALHEAQDICSECGGPLGDAVDVCSNCDENTDEDPTVLAPPAAYLARQRTEDSLENRPLPRRRINPPTPTPPPFADQMIEDEQDDLPTWVIAAMGGLALSLVGAVAVLVMMLG